MDNVRKLLQELMDEHGHKAKPLSIMLKKGPTYIGDFFKKNSPKFPDEETREALGDLYGLEPNSFRTGKRIPKAAKDRGVPIVLPNGEKPGLEKMTKIVGSEARVYRDGTMAIRLHSTEGPFAEIEIDQQALEQLRQNLSSLETYVRRVSS